MEVVGLQIIIVVACSSLSRTIYCTPHHPSQPQHLDGAKSSQIMSWKECGILQSPDLSGRPGQSKAAAPILLTIEILALFSFRRSYEGGRQEMKFRNIREQLRTIRVLINKRRCEIRINHLGQGPETAFPHQVWMRRSQQASQRQGLPFGNCSSVASRSS